MHDRKPSGTISAVVVIVLVHTGLTVLIYRLWAEAPTGAQATAAWRWVHWVWFPTGLLFPAGNETVLLMGGLVHWLGLLALVRWLTMQRKRIPARQRGDGQALTTVSEGPVTGSGHKLRRTVTPESRRWPQLLAPCRTTSECAVAVALGLLCAVVAVALLWHRAWDIDRTLAAQSRDWVPVSAVVTHSHIYQSTVGLGYEMDVDLSYEVEGRQFHHELYRFKSARARRDLERFRRTEDYEVGDTVRLYYNPLLPSEATRVPGTVRYFYTVMMVAACVLAPLFLAGGLSGLLRR